MPIAINEWITNKNKFYFNMLLIFKLLPKKSNILLYHNDFQSVMTYVCEAWSLTEGDSRSD